MQDGQTGQVVAPGEEPQPTSNWQFTPETPTQTQPADSLPEPSPPAPTVSAPPDSTASDGSTVSWTASEFIAHSKSASWYAVLMLAAAVLTAVVYLLTKDKISSGVVIVVAIIFAFAAARKPRELQYLVDNHGIRIADKDYPYQNFRSFAIVQEEGIESIWFMPLKRFMPILSIYFAPEDGDKIVDVLSKALPIEDHQPELVDRLMHRLHF